MANKDKGTFICYQPKKFNSDSMALIHEANKIIDDYQKQGFSLTLRQLYYQFVSRDMLPNTEKSYGKLGNVLSDGRLAGLISWSAIEDRTRNLRGVETFEHPSQAFQRARDSYRLDRWASQPFRPEVWIEKDALVGVISSICNDLSVDFFACRGYNSQSEQWRAGRRFTRYIREGQRPIVFHLGDHDPSGIDMTRDNQERLSMFAGTPILVQRLALNMAQIEQYQPPPNPAKITDSRFQSYKERYGESSWELDALEPMVIRDLIQEAILRVRDASKWDTVLAAEASDLESMDLAIDNM